jgi:hypothetical protein
MQRLFPWIATLATLIAASALAEPSLTPHRAEYKVRVSIVSGRMTTEVKRKGDGYLATHLIEPTGIAGALVGGEIFAESEFRPEADRLLPVRYSANDEISSTRLRADVEFDWETGQVTGTFQTRDDDSPQAIDQTLDAVAHDGVSIQYELMNDLMRSGPDADYILFDVDELKELSITTLGTQRITTGYGEFDAIGIRHQAEGSSRATTLWCAKELGYLPVVIERHRKGKLQMRARLVSYQPIVETGT